MGRSDYAGAEEQTIDLAGIWIRNSGTYAEVTPAQSSSQSTTSGELYRLQLGIDVPLNFTVRGRQPLVGVALQYAESDTDVESFFGNGNIDLEGYGFTTYATWYGGQGGYLDLQLLANWFEADLTPEDLRPLAEGSEAFGYAFSAEAGRSFKLCNHYSATPFAQLIYSAEKADDINDSYGVKFSDADSDGFLARVGTVLEKRVSRRKSMRNMFGSKPLERFSLYLTPGVTFNAGDSTEVDVSGTRLTQEAPQWQGDLSAGFTYDECGDYCSIYGELDLSTSLTDFGDSYSAGLQFGFRYKW